MTATLQVPATDLAAQWREIADEVEPVVLARLRSGNYLGQDAVEAFEAEFAQYVGGGVHAVACSSGTDAVELMVRATMPGRCEVLVPQETFVATASGVERAGCTPVFSPAFVHKMAVAVWLYGSTMYADDIARDCAERGVMLLEDASQAHGNRLAGRIGVAAAWSCYPSKNLGAAGQAGIVTFRDRLAAERAKRIREHGYDRTTDRHWSRGFNMRCDALQAEILRAKLKRLDKWVARKRDVAATYVRELSNVDGLRLPALEPDHAWHQFSVHVKNRDSVLAKMRERGVMVMVHYRTTADGRETEWTRENMSLPIFPHITDEQVAHVIASLKESLG